MKNLSIFLIGLISLCSCSDIIEVTDISNEKVTITAPVNNSVLNDSLVIFTWESTFDSESYHLQVAKPNFNQAEQVVIDTTLWSLNYSEILQTGQYQWRIRAENSAYQSQYTTNSFTVEE